MRIFRAFFAAAQKEEELARKKAAAEAEREADLQRPLRVRLGQVGFAELKAILVERGLPKEQAGRCMNKYALRELARGFEHLSAIAALEWAEEGENGDPVLV